MNKLIMIIAFILTLLTDAYSQSENDFSIGKSILFESKLLNKSEDIQIYIPNVHDKQTGKKFPVIYLFEGKRYFHTVSGIVKQLINANKIPETIVVGINPDRRYCFNKGLLDKYLVFIEKELQPFVVKNYQSAPYNIVVASSIFGQMGLYAFINQNHLFQSFILTSSFFTFSDHLYDFELFLNQQNQLTGNLFLSSGFEEEKKIDKIYKLARVLNRAPVKGLNWDYHQFDNENREMVLLNSVIKYLPQIFSDLQIPQIASYEDFEARFSKREEMMAKYQYDFFGLKNSPMSASQELLNEILKGNAVTNKMVLNYYNNPFYFIDDVEIMNLANYLFSINKNKEGKHILGFISKKKDLEFTNNYTSRIDLNRGLICSLSLDSKNLEEIVNNNGEVKNAITTTGINNKENSAVEITSRDGKIKLN